jgi:hypothetical protein
MVSVEREAPAQRRCPGAGLLFVRSMCGGYDPHAEIVLQSCLHQCVLGITVQCKNPGTPDPRVESEPVGQGTPVHWFSPHTRLREARLS